MIAWVVSGQSHVSYLEQRVRDQDIFRLDVSVNHVFRVHVADSLDDLSYEARGLLFGKALLGLLLEQLEQFSLRGVLEDEHYLRPLLKISV